MKIKPNARGLAFSLIVLCLLPWALIAAWVWLNVTVAATPPWLNALFSVMLILWMMVQFGRPPAWLAQRRVGRWGSWLFLILAALTGVLYASLALPDYYFYRFPLNWLVRILYWPLWLLIVSSGLVVQLRQAYQLGTASLQSILLQFRPFGLTLWLAALAVALAGRVVWMPIQYRPAPKLAALRARLARLPLRAGRVLAWLCRVLAIGLVCSLVLFGVAAYQNSTAPQIRWQLADAGLSVSPFVRALVLDGQDGTLYAGTGGGVFVSRDGGVSWQAASAGLTNTNVTALALGGEDGMVYAGTLDGGVFVSRDGGAYWQAASAGMTNTNVTALALDGRDGTLYAGTYGGGVFTSRDGGASWQAASAGMTNTSVTALVLGGYDGMVYAGTWGGGVFVSRDGGASWQATSAGMTNTNVTGLALDGRDGTLYAGTYGGGVFALRDGGANWRAASAGMMNTNVTVLVLGGHDGVVYAGTWGGGVFVSRDGGANWQVAGVGLTNTNVLALALDGRDGTVYAGTRGGGVFASRDDGASWQAASAGLTNTNVRALALDGRDGTLYAGTYSGVFASRDGGASWQAISAGMTNTNVTALVLDGRDGMLYVGTLDGGVFVSRDGGASWQGASAGLTNTNVTALALGGEEGMVYAGTLAGGVFISRDGGASWQAISAGMTNTNVTALALDGQDGKVYAGTRLGVFVSRDGGASWQVASAGLTNTNVTALALDERDGTLYAGTRLGVFVLRDDGASWQAVSAGMTDTNVLALALDGRDGTVYAGTYGGGVFVSRDGGENWRAASAGMTNTNVTVLALDVRDGTLYAGTYSGVFASRDGGVNWQVSGVGLTNTNVLALALGGEDGMVYAGTLDGGVFASRDGGANWQAASAGMTNTNVFALALDGRDGTLYAGTWGGGVFVSHDGGASWQPASAGLTNTNVLALALDGRDGTLYVGTNDGVFISRDGGASWQGAGAGLANTSVQALALDGRDGTVYAETWAGMFVLRDGGASWQKAGGIVTLIDSWLGLLPVGRSAVFGGRTDNTLVYASENAAWDPLTGVVFKSVALRRFPDGRAEVLTAFGGGIYRAPVSARPVPTVWLALRALVWLAQRWGAANARWLVGGLLLAFALSLAYAYANLARPFGLPLWAVLLARRRLDGYARPERLDAVWPEWEALIRAELVLYGDVITHDLRHVPTPFRRHALHRYAQTHAARLALDERPARLRLQTGAKLRRWRVAWASAGRALGRQPGLAPAGRAAVERLAALLTDVLGFTAGAARDFECVYARQVEAPALRLNIPPRFPLLFVADPQPGDHTVQVLVDAVDVLKESGFFALVVPLESAISPLNTADALRQAVARSLHVHDFVVLSNEDVLDILAARHPLQALARCILAQVDLAVVSPFVVNGPTPETMFFGREAEVKALVDGAGRADFAIIGNRRIGKTSLLRRAERRMHEGGRVRPLPVDCQTVRDAAGFYAEFQAQTGIVLPDPSPEGFASAMRALAQAGPVPMLLLDEVDALLVNERGCGEPLAATWRALAQAGVCHFVFCGATGLARRLDDPQSVFFNFPQPQPLGYLAPEVALRVLTQPLETLDIALEDAERLPDEVVVLTSGHPNLVQYAGRELVAAANRRGERLIMQRDLDDLRISSDFTDYYLKTVWGEAGPLERLITLLLPPEGATLGELETALAARGVHPPEEVLDAALKLLRIYATLEKRERVYTFIPRAFPDILRRTQEVERLIRQELRKLEESNPPVREA